MDRREFPRLETNDAHTIQVFAVTEGNQLHVLDVALGGMRLRCDQGINQIHLNEILLINILLNQKDSIEVTCRVRHVKQNKMSHIDFGVEFLNLKKEDHWLLHSYIEMQRLISPKTGLRLESNP